jgi:F0F1-type ATP synthase membrane subunit a
MTTNQRGCLTLLGMVLFGIFICAGIPFILLPSSSIGVTLPVITVPGEPLHLFLPIIGEIETVNTVLGMLLADFFVLLFALLAWRASKGWTKEVPGRGQGAMEALVEGLWGITKQMAPNTPPVRNILFPLMATIFFFLLAANWGKLIPGVESVGLIHCAHEGFSGFPRDEIALQNTSGGYQLRVETPLNAGYAASHLAYEQCASFKDPVHYADFIVHELDPFRDARLTHVVEEGDTLASIAEAWNVEVEEIVAGGLPSGDKYEQYESYAEVEFSAAALLALNPNLQGMAEGAEDDHGGGHGEVVVTEETPLVAGQEVVLREELVGEDATTIENQIYVVTPFFRGAATDLNLTIGLSIISFIAIQAFGIGTLGLNYFQKFINVHALGTISKNPLGAIDFIAGLFEIVSEIGKLVSLSFRLFGAIFAGGLLYAVFLFLFGAVIPLVILGLELIVGGAQAAVFSVLTLIFCAQAMVSHVHDDEHGEAHH